MSGKKKTSSNPFHLLQSEFGNAEYGLRQFRSDVAKLKKLGLVSKKVSARSQEPTRYMVGQVRKFANVIKGEAKAITVPKIELPLYKASGLKTKGRKAVIPAPRNAKVRRTKPKNGVPQYEVSIPSPNGGPGVRVEYPLLLADTEARAKLAAYVAKLPNLKKGQFYVFRFDGYMSGQTFSGPEAKEAMLEYFTRYRMPDEDDPDDYVMRFEIVTIEDRDAWRSAFNQQRKQSESNQRSRNRERYNAWRRRKLASMDELERRERSQKSEKQKTRDAEYHKEKREKLKKENPDAYRAMLDANAARMKRSRANRKK
jgi:hypothetical protein